MYLTYGLEVKGSTVKAKGHMGQGQRSGKAQSINVDIYISKQRSASALWYILLMLIKVYDTGRWAHFNVKLLHFFKVGVTPCNEYPSWNTH